MAEWSIPLNDPGAVHLWAHRAFKQYIKRTIAYKLARLSSSVDSEDNICQILDDAHVNNGGQITYQLIAKMVGRGVQGDEEVAGHEMNITTYTNSITINQLRMPAKIRGAVSQQLVPYNMRRIVHIRIADLWKERDNEAIINQACGNANQTDTAYTGNVATVAPSTTNMIIANIGGVPAAGHRANEAALVLGDTFDLSLVYDLNTLVDILRFPIRPIDLEGIQVSGVLLLHPLQVRSMKLSIGENQWAQYQLAAMKGGEVTGNPIFTGAIGMVEGIVIHKDPNICFGDGVIVGSNPNTALGPLAVGGDGGGVCRGVFLGAQALVMAMGRAQSDPLDKFKWVEELMDANNQLRVTAGKIYGIQKNRFDSTDFATITVSTYERV